MENDFEMPWKWIFVRLRRVLAHRVNPAWNSTCWFASRRFRVCGLAPFEGLHHPHPFVSECLVFNSANQCEEARHRRSKFRTERTPARPQEPEAPAPADCSFHAK